MKRITLSLIVLAAIASGAFYCGTRQTPATSSAPSVSSAVQRPALSAALTETDPLQHRALFIQWLAGLTADEASSAATKIWALPGDLNEVTKRKKLFCYAWGQTAGEADTGRPLVDWRSNAYRYWLRRRDNR